MTGKFNHSFKHLALVSAALGLVATAVHAAEQTAAPAPAVQSAAAALGHPAEVAIQDTKRIDFVSSVNGRRYSIDVALPSTPPPPAGYPVIYVIDGYGYFASVTEAARANGNAPNMVVVGISYPRDDAWAESVLSKHRPLPPMFAGYAPFQLAAGIERQHDLTLAADEDTLRQLKTSGMNGTAADFNGLDGFLQMIEADIKPRVYGLAKINHGDQTLFGHSLGGLAVIEALFTEPTAYRTYVAASPSIWWGRNLVLGNEASFRAAVSAGKASPRVLIEVGGEEETVPVLPPEMADRKAAIEASVKRSRMIGHACDLADRLKALSGVNGYKVAGCITFPGQGHGISVWPAIGQALTFATRP